MSEVATDDRTTLEFDRLKAVGGDEFKWENTEDLIEAMATKPEVWDKVHKDLAAIEKMSEAEREAIVKKPEEKESAAAAGDDASKGEADTEKFIALDGIKIKPEWLGAYGQNRKPDEAIAEMHKGNVEKDKTINFYKLERVPAIEQERDAIAAKLVEIQKENEELKKAKPVAVESPEKKPEQKQDEEIVIPQLGEEPEMPEPLAVDDAYDEEKQAAWKKEYQGYKEKKKEYDKARTVYFEAVAEKKARERTESVRKELDEIKNSLSSFQKQSAEATEKNKITDEEMRANQAREQEYSEIEELRAAHADVLGVGRPVNVIEADYIEFLKNLSSLSGVSGSIHVPGTTRIRPEVHNALQAFQNAASPVGQKLRDAADLKGIKMPDDFDVLQKIYQIRSIARQHAVKDPASGQFVRMPYSKAFVLAATENPALNAANLTKETRDEKAEEIMRRNKAEEKAGTFAKEAQPEDSAAAPGIDGVTERDMFPIINKSNELRTEQEKKLLYAVAEKFKLKPEEFGLPPRTK